MLLIPAERSPLTGVYSKQARLVKSESQRVVNTLDGPTVIIQGFVPPTLKSFSTYIYKLA